MGKAKILIVEDEEVLVKCMKVILTQEGYSVSGIVASGEEAVEVALKTRPDLILMEMKLRGKIDGIIAYEQIKKSADIPVLFVSTYADKETIDRAMQTEASGFLAKPFKNSELREKVKAALASHAKLERRASS